MKTFEITVGTQAGGTMLKATIFLNGMAISGEKLKSVNYGVINYETYRKDNDRFGTEVTTVKPDGDVDFVKWYEVSREVESGVAEEMVNQAGRYLNGVILANPQYDALQVMANALRVAGYTQVIFKDGETVFNRNAVVWPTATDWNN